MTLGVAMSLVIGNFLFRGGLISLGTVYLIVTYTNLLRRPIRELTQQVENLQNIGAATERLRELRNIEAKITDGSGDNEQARYADRWQGYQGNRG